MSKEFIVKETVLFEARIKADSKKEAQKKFQLEFEDCTDTITEYIDMTIEEVK